MGRLLLLCILSSLLCSLLARPAPSHVPSQWVGCTHPLPMCVPVAVNPLLPGRHRVQQSRKSNLRFRRQTWRHSPRAAAIPQMHLVQQGTAGRFSFPVYTTRTTLRAPRPITRRTMMATTMVVPRVPESKVSLNHLPTFSKPPVNPRKLMPMLL